MSTASIAARPARKGGGSNREFELIILRSSPGLLSRTYAVRETSGSRRPRNGRALLVQNRLRSDRLLAKLRQAIEEPSVNRRDLLKTAMIIPVLSGTTSNVTAVAASRNGTDSRFKSRARP